MDKKVITLKTQHNAENAWGNRMWQLGLKEKKFKNFFYLDFSDLIVLGEPVVVENGKDQSFVESFAVRDLQVN